MKIKGSVALVTGANRGLGAAFVGALLDDVKRNVRAGLGATPAVYLGTGA